MEWMRRILMPWATRGTPPTVPNKEQITFHCPECRTPVDHKATYCPMCAADLRPI